MDDTHCELYDWLPSLIRSLSHSIKQLSYSQHPQIASYALAFIHQAIQQGLLYAVDCIELSVRHLTSPIRTVHHVVVCFL